MTKADAEISDDSEGHDSNSDQESQQLQKPSEVLPHLLEKRINDPWNQVLFEVKLLRDYFVDESVLPKYVAQDSNFLNEFQFTQRFLPGINQKYSVILHGEMFELKQPAFLQFFKSKLVTQEMTDEFNPAIEAIAQKHLPMTA